MARRNHYQQRRKDGYMSGLEAEIGQKLDGQGIDYEYETLVVRFTEPAKKRRYTPDFVLPNGIIVEVKGRFTSSDRQKHIHVRNCHPDLDIRFVFSRSKARISTRSETTYAKWCQSKGFEFADKMIPHEWLKEKPNKASLAAIAAIRAGG